MQLRVFLRIAERPLAGVHGATQVADLVAHFVAHPTTHVVLAELGVEARVELVEAGVAARIAIVTFGELAEQCLVEADLLLDVFTERTVLEDRKHGRVLPSVFRLVLEQLEFDVRLDAPRRVDDAAFLVELAVRTASARQVILGDRQLDVCARVVDAVAVAIDVGLAFLPGAVAIEVAELFLGARVQREQVLHAALAERTLADDLGATEVLEGAGGDLTGRSR